MEHPQYIHVLYYGNTVKLHVHVLYYGNTVKLHVQLYMYLLS